MLTDFYNTKSLDDPYYGSFSLVQEETIIMTNETDGSSYREYIFTEIPFSECVLGKNFFYDNADEIAQYSLNLYYCADWNNLTLQGNWYSPQF